MAKGDGIKWLEALGPLATSAVAVFTAFAGLVVVGGGANRMLSNHPNESIGSLACIAAAVTFAMVAALASTGRYAAIKGSAFRFILLSGLAFAFGLFFAASDALKTAGDHSEGGVWRLTA